MTREQRRMRAEIINEQPALWLFLLYAGGFFGMTVVGDLLGWTGEGPFRGPGRYLVPLAITFPIWIGMRQWALRIVYGRADGTNGPEHPPA
jgi:hypothetical protein